MKILYIGVGEHFDVIEHFTDCNEFIFVDSRPINDYGYDYYYKPFYRSQFVATISESLKKLGFILEHSAILTNNFTEINRPYLESTKLTFTNKNLITKENRHITYYISTSIPNHLQLIDLQNDIRSCNAILISGFHPANDILELLPTPHTFIGYSETVYPKPYEMTSEPENYIDVIAKDTYQEIKEFILVNNITGDKTTFSNYKAFYDYNFTISGI
jgi:hypothetical protein